MADDEKRNTLRLGFLTAVEIAGGGYVGGLLVTNRFGRPLEFQCTAPVKPNRTQQILFGPTLAGFVLGELIGKTLVEKAGVKPHFILTNREDILELRNHVSIPVALLAGNADGVTQSDDSSPTPMQLGRRKVRFHPAHPADADAVRQHHSSIPEDADLAEPFERVAEALGETLRTANVK